jgi:biopolymer transport protein TolR
MSMAFGSRDGQTAEMNVTPLIDVLLVLIIIFMVVIPHHSHGEQADIPQAAPTDNNIVVQLLDGGEGKRPTLKINASGLSYEVSWDELVPDLVPGLMPDLVSKMREILAARASRIVFLKADPDVAFEFVAQAVDLTRAAGAERVGLMPGGR